MQDNHLSLREIYAGQAMQAYIGLLGTPFMTADIDIAAESVKRAEELITSLDSSWESWRERCQPKVDEAIISDESEPKDDLPY